MIQVWKQHHFCVKRRTWFCSTHAEAYITCGHLVLIELVSLWLWTLYVFMPKAYLCTTGVSRGKWLLTVSWVMLEILGLCLRFFVTNGACPSITGTTVLMTYIQIKTRNSFEDRAPCRWNLRVPDLQMYCRDVTRFVIAAKRPEWRSSDMNSRNIFKNFMLFRGFGCFMSPRCSLNLETTGPYVWASIH